MIKPYRYRGILRDLEGPLDGAAGTLDNPVRVERKECREGGKRIILASSKTIINVNTSCSSALPSCGARQREK